MGIPMEKMVGKQEIEVSGNNKWSEWKLLILFSNICFEGRNFLSSVVYLDVLSKAP